MKASLLAQLAPCLDDAKRSVRKMVQLFLCLSALMQSPSVFVQNIVALCEYYCVLYISAADVKGVNIIAVLVCSAVNYLIRF